MAKKKVMAKVSPLKGMSVEAWLETHASGWQRQVSTALLDTARRADPSALVSIKWGIPILEDHGPVAFLKIAKAHVTFGFWRGAALSDPAGRLEGGAKMRHLKFRSLDDLDASLVAGFVRQAVRLNRTLGDPSRRR